MKQKSKECGERHWRRKAEEKSGGKNCTDEEGESGGVEWRKMVEGSMKGQWRRGEWSGGSVEE